MALLAAPALAAQTTSVTGQVLDPNGIPYSSATIKAQLAVGGVAISGQPTVTVSNQAQCISAGMGNAPCQIPFQGTFGPITLDGNGNIPGGGIALQDNTLVTPGGTQWLFSVAIAPGIAPPLGLGPQTFSVAITISGASQNIGATLSAAAPKLTNFTGTGGTISGAISATHLTFASGLNTAADVAGSAVTPGTGAIALTAGADTTTDLTLNSHSATQSATMLDVNHQSTGGAGTGTLAAPALFEGRGLGVWGIAGSATVVGIQQESSATAPDALIITNKQALSSSSRTSDMRLFCPDNGICTLSAGNAVGDGSGKYSLLSFDANQSIYGASSLAGSLGFLFVASSSGGIPVTIWQANGLGNTFDMLDIAKGTSPGFPLVGIDSCGSTVTTDCNLYFNGLTSGQAKIGVVPVAGSPCIFKLPTVSAAANALLYGAAPSAQSDGSSCLTSWSQNCSSSASPAVCGSAQAGSVTIAAAASTITVNTTAVTANSQITLQTDDTLGTKLGVTCNSTIATLVGGLAVTARTAGTSFQITSGATPAVNPLCISYLIVN